MNKALFGNLPLPASSRAEDLETVSRQKLAPLFPPEQFELRSETERDKGIDLIVEVKELNRYTNFRFAIQLKATAKIKLNVDGSLSFPLDVSNIGYLSNYVMPAYYVVYDSRNDIFYVEESSLVRNLLYEKYKLGKYPNQFKVRFCKVLTSEVIQGMYNNTLQQGSFFKTVNNHLDLLRHTDSISGIFIDSNRDVHSIEENIRFITDHGLHLLNQANFEGIIQIEQRSHPRENVPAMFELVCGLAYYHKGKIHKSLDLLLAASKRCSEFDLQLQTGLAYSILQAKYEVGILSKEAFKEASEEIMNKKDIGSYLQLEKAYAWIKECKGDENENFMVFCDRVNCIVESERQNPKARILGYARVLEVGAEFLLNDLSKNLNTWTGEGRRRFLPKVLDEWKLIQDNYFERLDSLMKYVFKHNDIHSMGNLSRLKIEWVYRCFYTKLFFENWSFKSLSAKWEISVDRRADILKACSFLDKTASFHESIGDYESVVLNMVLKYELLHVIKENEKCEQIAADINSLIEKNDFFQLQLKFSKILDQGTRHEKFLKHAQMLLVHLYEIAKNEGFVSALFEPYTEDMLKFDADITDNSVKWTFSKFMVFEFTD
ncbi:protein of unknown function [Pedobacter steynii]|uniref:DUF4365 domain-containing protein n=1 Tax=Pedobacter steynii TaxID=430522 RepID=A0A1H0KB96_9SPHI|nr:DUF4365 domain-containing protein [Pedobacter steynii]NQX43246.1 DUF4365 domain-containing protein [Pedobacter steynii]SDO53126.1 protein of unknown function [Pedobacter steynii]